MRALFVHGMGRSPMSGWPLLRRLQQAGIATATFGYSTTLECFSAIQERLASRLLSFANTGDYFLIGHSLGGVLLRSALATLPPSVHQPRHLFLLGSPTRSARLARQLASNKLFGFLTGDCGQLLASESAMAAIAPPRVPSTAIIGTTSLPFGLNRFPGESSDGIVTYAEVDAAWLSHRVTIKQIHTLLPSSSAAANVILKTVLGHVP